jgi:SAM-dependent methyltransferase
MLAERIKTIVNNNYFSPSFLGLFTNPFYFARKGLDRHVAKLSPFLKGRILDVGCGLEPYKGYFKYTEYMGLEVEGRNKNADFHYDGKTFPFKDGEIDSVLTSQVLEHVFNPDDFISEVYRVLNDNGTLLLTVPFVWDEHEQPFDCCRYTSFGIAHLLEKHGLTIIRKEKSVNDIKLIFQLLILYIYKKCPIRNKYCRFLFTLMLISPINILGEIAGAIVPENNDLYLDNVILAQKIRRNNV